MAKVNINVAQNDPVTAARLMEFRAYVYKNEEKKVEAPMFAVKYAGGAPYTEVRHGKSDWSKLFGLDADGDAILMNLFAWLDQVGGDTVGMSRGLDVFVSQYLAWREDHFGSNEDLAFWPSGGEQVQEDGGEVSPPLTPADIIRASEGFKALAGHHGLAPCEVPDAVFAALMLDHERAGIDMGEYLDGLKDYGDGLACYLAEDAFPQDDGTSVRRVRSFSYNHAAHLWEALIKGKAEWLNKGEEKGVPPSSPPAEEAKAAAPAEPFPTLDELKSLTHRLRHETKVGRSASEDDMKALAVDCWNCLRQGVSLDAYKSALKSYSSVEDYLTEPAAK